MTFADLAPPILYTVFVWWFSTGAILWLVRLQRETFRASLAVLALCALAALAGVVLTADDTSATGAYAAFTAALCVWGWHEASFLMGVVTGPRPTACPPGATGWRRFKYAALTVLHHEIALALTAVGIVGLTWGQPNQVASGTFLVLLAMRLSAKFNVFLGVPNLTEEFFPAHLEHLKSYLPKRAMNVLFPVSVAASVLLAAYLMQRANNAAPGSGEAVGFILLFTLTSLALIEHAFMILPVPDAALWRWAAPERKIPESAPPGSHSSEEPHVEAQPFITRRSFEAEATQTRPATVRARD